MKRDAFPKSRRDSLVSQDLNGEILLYDLKINKAYALNETSTLVWQECDGSRSISDISRSISQKLSSEANEDVVWLAIEEFKQSNLLDNADALPAHFAGMSRREVIKKVGLGTMIALPIVAGMVAPNPVSAQSLVGLNAPCTAACTGGIEANNCAQDGMTPLGCCGFISGAPLMNPDTLGTCQVDLFGDCGLTC